MPYQPILPTWTAWNNANFTSPTALTDPRTGQPFPAGGLNLGDYFDATNQEAKQGSYTTNGLLFAGRYRYVHVDSGATAANVKTGTVGYLRAGSYITSVVITSAGSGQTAGTYTVAANFGNGGTGAIIQVVVGSAGTVTSATVVQGGYGYTAAPTFTLVTGGSVGTVVAQLNTTPNVVTSADQGLPKAGRQVVFLNSITPGNYGFIQELGTASVLAGGAVTIAHFVNSSTSDGTVTDGTTTFIPTTVGTSLEAGSSGNLFKIVMTTPVVQD
jgi:hypothetical protein